MRAACLAAAGLALALTAAACSSAGPSTAAGDAAGRAWAVPGASGDQLRAAAPVVTARLERFGITGVTVQAGDGKLTASADVDPIAMEAAGRRGPTELWTVTSTTVGPCPASGPGAPSVPAGRRCHVLGTRLAGTEAVASATPGLQPGLGWSVELYVDSAGYAPLRGALASAAGAPVAVVADGVVVAVIDSSAVPGLHSRIEPGLTQREATRLAYALLVRDTSPVAVPVADPGPEPGPVADADFFLAAVSVNVCGTWLPDAPATPDASGIHSHGDGFVYAHPQSPAEAGDKATLGLWLSHGDWSATAERLQLWDGAAHTTGDTCPDGRPGTVRWWVDGAEQQGDPEKLRIGNGQAITLSFNPSGVDPGPGPTAGRLPLPKLTPEA